MSRSLVPVLAFALMVAACGSSTVESSTTETVDGPITTSTAVDTTAPPGSDQATTSTATSQSPGTTSDRPLAPDFTLELGDGASYTLSEGAKPVYLVFWAEW